MKKNLYKTCGIYEIFCTKTNKAYIGSTSINFGDRRDCHFASLRNGYHFNKKMQEDFDTFGEGSFKFKVIECVEPGNIEKCQERERYWIKKLNTINDGYNVSTGGIFEGIRPSKEKIRQMTELNRIYNTGKKCSEETKRNMSRSNRHGAVLKKEDVYSIKIRLINRDGVNEIAKEYNVSPSCISQINVDKNWRSVIVPGWDEYQENRT